MKTKKAISFSAVAKSLVLALIAVLAEVIVYITVIIEGIVQPEVMVGSLGLFMVSVLNAFFCFFIVKHNPISILFVPLIINVFIMVMAFFNTANWLDSWWVPVASGWVLCLMASIIGLLIRKRTSNSDVQLERV